MTCVVNAMDENGMRLLLSLGHHHHCLYDSHVTVVTNVSDPVRVLLVMSSAASGSMSTSEQDTSHIQHTHVINVNLETRCQLFKTRFQLLQLAILNFHFLIFNFYKTRFQFFDFQLLNF